MIQIQDYRWLKRVIDNETKQVGKRSWYNVKLKLWLHDRFTVKILKTKMSCFIFLDQDGVCYVKYWPRPPHNWAFRRNAAWKFGVSHTNSHHLCRLVFSRMPWDTITFLSSDLYNYWYIGLVIDSWKHAAAGSNPTEGPFPSHLSLFLPFQREISLQMSHLLAWLKLNLINKVI